MTDEVDEKEIKLTPFSFLNTITGKKRQNIIDNAINPDLAEKSYTPWIVNLGLSHYINGIFQANEMNINPNLPNKMQYDYLLNTVKPVARYEKWIKVPKEENLELVQKYFGYNKRKASAALALMSKEYLEELKKQFYTGGS